MTTVSSGQTLYISAGQTSSGIIVDSGGILDVLSGGTAISATLSSGGFEFMNGTASDTDINSGGYETVASGGTASGTTLSGGTEYVSSGSIVFATIVGSGGHQTVLSGGTASGSIISAGGDLELDVGGTAISATLSGGFEIVNLNGMASDTAIDSGGYELVISGGAASGTRVNSGGLEGVNSGGTASGTTVNGGGVEQIDSGGTASGTTANGGGFEIVESGGTATGTRVSGGGEYIAAGGTATGTTLGPGGTIDVAYLPYVSGGAATLDPTTDVLTLSVGGQTYTQQLSGNYTNDDLLGLASDGAGGTNIQLARTSNPIVNAMLSGSTWAQNVGMPTNITYSFMTSAPAADAGSGFQQISAADQAIVSQALQTFSTVGNITFTLVPGGGNADIMFGENNQTYSAGLTYVYPGSTQVGDGLVHRVIQKVQAVGRF